MYSYGVLIHVWDTILSYTRTGYPIRVWANIRISGRTLPSIPYIAGYFLQVQIFLKFPNGLAIWQNLCWAIYIDKTGRVNFYSSIVGCKGTLYSQPVAQPAFSNHQGPTWASLKLLYMETHVHMGSHKNEYRLMTHFGLANIQCIYRKIQLGIN